MSLFPDAEDKLRALHKLVICSTTEQLSGCYGITGWPLCTHSLPLKGLRVVHDCFLYKLKGIQDTHS